MKKNYWNEIYKTEHHKSIWPWDDVIKLIKKFTNLKKKNKNILEIGCGLGANIPFFLYEKFDYYGIDFSTKAVKKIKKKFPRIKKKIILSDLVKFNFSLLKTKFNIILDRGTITHITDKNIKKILNQFSEITNKNSILVCCSLYSDKCTDRMKYKNKNIFKKGLFANVGYINFFNKKKLKKMFNQWEILFMEEVDYYDHIKKNRYRYWNLVLKKK